MISQRFYFIQFFVYTNVSNITVLILLECLSTTIPTPYPRKLQASESNLSAGMTSKEHHHPNLTTSHTFTGVSIINTDAIMKVALLVSQSLSMFDLKVGESDSNRSYFNTNTVTI